jgi:hypothetical protein
MTLRIGALIVLLACSVTGCFLFHKPTPQQQLFEALNRGEGPQATQIWLKMSPEDRMKFSRGQGITPAVPPQAAIKKLTEMDPEEMQGQVTIKPPNASGGSLMDLPHLAAPSGVAPPPPRAPETPQAPEQQ